ncbi:MAG: site-specific integrase [Chloroflexi bacterium]|nr:site-specific integrase [Chloroflexota bacterium]
MAAELLTLRVVRASPLDAVCDAFLLDREASRCTPKTLEHYQYTVGTFVGWLTQQGIPDVAQITPHLLRAYLVGLQRRGLKDTTQHAHARGIKAWLNWLVEEGDLAQSPMRGVAMPRLEKRIPAPFSQAEVNRLLAACDRPTRAGSRN